MRKSSGYPSYIGAPEFRQAIAQWIQKRFGIQLDVATEISSTIGSKEAVFNFPEGIVNPGDYVIIPSPGYPPYTRGTLFAEGIPYYVPLLAENKFLIDLKAIPEEICRKTKIMWINYPNSPTGATAPLSYLKEIVEFGKNIILSSPPMRHIVRFTLMNRLTASWRLQKKVSLSLILSPRGAP